MKKFILLVLLLLISAGQSLRMKRIVLLPAGADLPSTYIISSDTDNDSLNELIFSTMTSTPYIQAWMIYEYHSMNRYELVYADTGAYPLPPGIKTGNFSPNDVGDIDRDSLTDLLGFNIERTPDSFYNVITTQESPNYHLYPESLSWWYTFHPGNTASFGPSYFSIDLDNDGRNEIVCLNPYDGYTYIFENISNNQNQIVWSHYQVGACSFAFGDFDLDSRKEFVTADLGSLGKVSVYENTGPDQYEMTFQDTVCIPNGSDVFSGNDLDGDGKPEFFVGFAQYVGGNIWDFFLYMWEATSNNSYERTHIATIRAVDWLGKRSKCGDIDGDGIEELVWSIGGRVIEYKATGNNQFEQIWLWTNDHGGDYPHSLVNIYDMNNNGYNEIVVSGNNKTSIFEVEAVWLRRPNGGENFVGDSQEQIRWQEFYPPRCDSLSLFYSLDNGRTYDTIITGLPGIDSSYIWTVPDTSSDSCKVKIIAYGPGWQFDESDGVFTITPSGIEESRPGIFTYFKFEMLPNPAKGKIRFKIWNANQDLSLKIYNLAGELVKTFTLSAVNGQRSAVNEIIWDGKDDSGKKLPAGVYVYRLKTTEGISETKEFIILK